LHDDVQDRLVGGDGCRLRMSSAGVHVQFSTRCRDHRQLTFSENLSDCIPAFDRAKGVCASCCCSSTFRTPTRFSPVPERSTLPSAPLPREMPRHVELFAVDVSRPSACTTSGGSFSQGQAGLEGRRYSSGCSQTLSGPDSQACQFVTTASKITISCLCRWYHWVQRARSGRFSLSSKQIRLKQHDAGLPQSWVRPHDGGWRHAPAVLNHTAEQGCLQQVRHAHLCAWPPRHPPSALLWACESNRELRLGLCCIKVRHAVVHHACNQGGAYAPDCPASNGPQ
jgi:hypothetical protein